MRGKKIIIDTNIIIDYQRTGDNKVLDRLCQMGSELIVVATIIQELYTGRSTKSKKIKSKLGNFLDLLEVVEIDAEIAKKAGELVRDGEINDVMDAQIAAAAVVKGYQLATMNNKHFRGVNGLKLVKMTM